MKIGIITNNLYDRHLDMVAALEGQYAMVRHARDRGWDSFLCSMHYLSDGDIVQMQQVPLLARLQAVLRRAAQPATDDGAAPLKVHDVEMHPGRQEVTVAGQPVKLTHREFLLLHTLARRPGWVFTRNQIVESVHGDDYPVTERAVDVQIVGLRKKLGAAGEYVETVRGVGYRFKE